MKNYVNNIANIGFLLLFLPYLAFSQSNNLPLDKTDLQKEFLKVEPMPIDKITTNVSKRTYPPKNINSIDECKLEKKLVIPRIDAIIREEDYDEDNK